MKKRRLLSAFLAASLLCTMAPPATVLATETNTETVEEQNSVRSGELTVTGGVAGTDYEIQDGVIKILKDTSLTFSNAGSRYILNVPENIDVDIRLKSSVTLEFGQLDANSTVRVVVEDDHRAYCDFGKGTYQNLLGKIIFGSDESSGTLDIRNSVDTWGNGDLQFDGGDIQLTLYRSLGFQDITVNGGNLSISYAQNQNGYSKNITADNFIVQGGNIEFDIADRGGHSVISAKNCMIMDGSIAVRGETQVPDAIGMGYWVFLE